MLIIRCLILRRRSLRKCRRHINRLWICALGISRGTARVRRGMADIRAVARAARVVMAVSSIIGSSISIMARIMEGIHITQVEVVVGPETFVVIYGVEIHCVNVWEVICAHASKV